MARKGKERTSKDKRQLKLAGEEVETNCGLSNTIIE